MQVLLTVRRYAYALHRESDTGKRHSSPDVYVTPSAEQASAVRDRQTRVRAADKASGMHVRYASALSCTDFYTLLNLRVKSLSYTAKATKAWRRQQDSVLHGESHKDLASTVDRQHSLIKHRSLLCNHAAIYSYYIHT